ncbi:hypothetical protein G5V65_17140 [Rhodobacter sp. HX-7-19]|uniref:DUF3576 domain-containing protein n=1 Tax=Paragemmobacter kunshanensis TaxID=2583234 RepID=A0A6M1UB27_9RHOB|nr:hypothetical protein [Rhodobacter kunshanensis]NGQ92621.1 hypothetical protein [Rhodobacter kunshanensis]
MRKTVLAALGIVLMVAGCGAIRESRLNPFNWFGRAEPRETVATAAPQDERLLVAQVVSLSVDPYSTGAIVRARGIPPSQGWWDAELVARPLDENGVLVFDFRVFPPITNTPEGTPRSREITVAAALSNVKLDQVREIVVQGATNALSSRR